jgi:transcriptional regulator with XRE-family HTH domain
MKGKKTNVDFDLILKLNKEGYTTTEIAEKLNIPVRTLSGIIKRNNIPIQKRLMKTFKNENYFEELNSPLKAYLFGFLIADGYIVKENKGNNKFSYRLGIEINKDDEIIIHRLAKELNMEDYIHYRKGRTPIINGKQVKNSKEVCTFRCTSKKLVFDLINHGMDYSKTSDINLTLSENIFNGLYFFDFLRGLIDGDGTITSNIGAVSICGYNRKLFETIQNKLLEFYPNIYTDITFDNDLEKCFTFRISGGRTNPEAYILNISSKI